MPKLRVNGLNPQKPNIMFGFLCTGPLSGGKVCGNFLRESPLAAAFGRLRKRIFSHYPRQFNLQRPVRFLTEERGLR